MKIYPYLYWLAPIGIGLAMWLEKTHWHWTTNASWILYIALQYTLLGLIALLHKAIGDFFEEYPVVKHRLPWLAIPLLVILALVLWVINDFSLCDLPPLTSLVFYIEAILIGFPMSLLLLGIGTAFGLVVVLGMGEDLLNSLTRPFRQKSN